MVDPRDLERADLEAVVEVRRELGRDYEPALVDSFVDRVEAAIEARVDARIAETRSQARAERSRSRKQLALGACSLVLGIPLTALGGGMADLPGIAVTWAGIAAVNLSFAWQNRTIRPRRA